MSALVPPGPFDAGAIVSHSITITLDDHAVATVPLWVVGGFLLLWVAIWFIIRPSESSTEIHPPNADILATLEVIAQKLRLIEEKLQYVEDKLRLVEDSEDTISYYVTAKGGKLHTSGECTNLGSGDQLWELPISTPASEWFQNRQKQVFCVTCVARRRPTDPAQGNTSS